MVQLNDELIELLDERASHEGVSRSQVIRTAIEAFLATDRASLIDQQIVEGYSRKPQGGEYDADYWGDVASLMTALTVDQMQQLNKEEHAAGFDPW
jgi:predicted transcriptional regulator